MSTELERLAALEAHRGAHEDRHERHERSLEASFRKIDEQFNAGHARFDKIDLTLIEIKAACNGGSRNGGSSRRRDIVIKLGAPLMGGTGIGALILYFVERSMN